MTAPPPALIASLVDGPSLVTAVQWHERCDSTNAVAAGAAADGALAGLLVLADEQTAGRGRHGRTWVAPAGSSLLLSLVLRPGVAVPAAGLLPLLAGLVLAETVSRHLPEADVTLKWPNDLLVGGAKAAGILAESSAGAVVLGMGVNVDWRGVDRPVEVAGATSLADAAGHDIDRWRLLAGLMGVFSRRYDQWLETPAAFLDDYRRRCATLGEAVRVHRTRDDDLEGVATDIDPRGALLVRTADAVVEAVTAGDVEHLR